VLSVTIRHVTVTTVREDKEVLSVKDLFIFAIVEIVYILAIEEAGDVRL
jgi:hypothetical protein